MAIPNRCSMPRGSGSRAETKQHLSPAGRPCAGRRRIGQSVVIAFDTAFKCHCRRGSAATTSWLVSLAYSAQRQKDRSGHRCRSDLCNRLPLLHWPGIAQVGAATPAATRRRAERQSHEMPIIASYESLQLRYTAKAMHECRSNARLQHSGSCDEAQNREHGHPQRSVLGDSKNRSVGGRRAELASGKVISLRCDLLHLPSTNWKRNQHEQRAR
jgi:hypothetical protein